MLLISCNAAQCRRRRVSWGMGRGIWFFASRGGGRGGGGCEERKHDKVCVSCCSLGEWDWIRAGRQRLTLPAAEGTSSFSHPELKASGLFLSLKFLFRYQKKWFSWASVKTLSSPTVTWPKRFRWPRISFICDLVMKKSKSHCHSMKPRTRSANMPNQHLQIYTQQSPQGMAKLSHPRLTYTPRFLSVSFPAHFSICFLASWKHPNDLKVPKTFLIKRPKLLCLSQTTLTQFCPNKLVVLSTHCIGGWRQSR